MITPGTVTPVVITPSQRFYGASAREPRKVAVGVDKIADCIAGTWHRRPGLLRRLHRGARAALRHYERSIAGLEEADFREKIRETHRRVRRGEISRKLTTESLACVARAARDVLGLTPYPEQFMGVLAIGEGLFAEMATGEGKTLTIGMAGVLAGWRGQPCHIITSNDYLAKRDAETLGDFYRYCGLDAGYVVGEMKQEERPAQYQKPVVYSTSQELLADFLRDRLKLGADQSPQRRLIRYLSPTGGSNRGRLVMRGIHSVIIDEADNILIDEAVTPLIISQTLPGDSFAQCCRIACDLAGSLRAGIDYLIDYKHSEITLKNEGKSAIGRHSHRLPPTWRSLDRRNELVRQALVAECFFERDKHYVVTEDGVEIVDEFTGRILPGRTWKQGLHQAIEAKEGLEVTDPAETLASMSFQRFFRSFARISGVSGTARESAHELWRIYRLAVVCIPTHRPVDRTIEKPLVFSTLAEKYAAVVSEIREKHAAGRPVLVGTRTVEASELLSGLLTVEGLTHSVLNAVRHKEEAEIISHAGEAGRITIATNMAGRGTDIKLPSEVQARGGLHVIVVEHNLSPRIDRQLVGRSARQGEPGSARFYLCLEDELFRRFLRPFAKRRVRRAVQWHTPGYVGYACSACRKAQRTAETLGAQQREAVLKMDTWLEEHLSFTRSESR
ncbi:MAG: hypothetical protein KA152_00800 [Verrucomicrobiales bacterium]|nr:hypothetical protein [Verrucomicrobiales bacterium]